MVKEVVKEPIEVGQTYVVGREVGNSSIYGANSIPPGTFFVTAISKDSFSHREYISGMSLPKKEKNLVKIYANLCKKDLEEFKLPIRKQITIKKLIKEYLANNLYSVLRHGNGYCVGSDPEVFVLDGKGNLLPAWKFLPAKNKAKTTTDGVMSHWDGFQAEFCTKPLTCLGYHVDQLHYGLKDILTKAQLVDPKASLTWETIVKIPKPLMDSAEDIHCQLGCAPSQNIYEEFIPPVSEGRDIPIRFAGCHIHFGYEKNHWTDTNIQRAVRGADHIGAVIATALFNKMEHPERRMFYGRPGEYRVADNRDRLEYRVISSAALVHPGVSHLIFDMVRQGIRAGEQNLLDSIWSAKDVEMREVIINCDVKGARKILNRNRKVLVDIFAQHYGGTIAGQRTLTAVLNGLTEFLDVAASNMPLYWRLNESTPPWICHSEVPHGHWTYIVGGRDRWNIPPTVV